MMPLALGDAGKEYGITRVSGSDEVRAHLQDMGFVPGAKVTLISASEGNVIVNVKNVRVALSTQLAQKLYI